ncbi:YiiD C-terminal domain-containing protein [Spectribacter hydrogenooxidans]|uniref:YiiD C-terminal domain-containing protein n=1 Tax=Spectribacter hydrogenoxidans TaxID=3075608 RepID=A0ABU3BZR1_9GAMM|nr:YiiD C-terminal domain-containing protein [Salinisphaera sp. W335]MDT0634803.1 YiiD C-terminal domain-containing protein [Salinisphaera sp. W335]
MTDEQRKALQVLLDQHIPLAAAMQITLADAGDDMLTVTAPLGANANHYGTAFGGSLYTVALVAGWGLASMKLDGRGMVVVQHADADYRRPVRQDLLATARCRDEGRFAADFADRGQAELDLTVSIEAGNRRAFALQARFAARPLP